MVEARDFASDLLLKDVQARVVAVLRMAEALSPKYHVVVANPPYAGAKGLNSDLQNFSKDAFPESKFDLFAMFMQRSLDACLPKGMVSMVNMQSWMFLSTYEKFRSTLANLSTILSMAHLGTRAFDTIGGEIVSTTAFVLQKLCNRSYVGDFLRLTDGRSEEEKRIVIRKHSNRSAPDGHYRASWADFEKIPGNPIAYWAGSGILEAFNSSSLLSELCKPMIGMRTGDNEKFLRQWSEVSFGLAKLNATDRISAKVSEAKWFPYNKGGEFRKWFGNCDLFVNWENDGQRIKTETLEKYPQLSWDNLGWKISNEKYFFKTGVTWTATSTGGFGVRKTEGGFLFDVKGSSAFPKEADIGVILGLLASKPADVVLKMLNPTIETQPRDVGNIPCPLTPTSVTGKLLAERIIPELIRISKSDWDAYETSWDFTTLPLLQTDHRAETLEDTYTTLRTHWQGMTDEMQRLEEENNRIFIDAYGLQDELTPEVPLNEITLTCNPAYRYGIKNDTAANETRLRADTMAEFLSYAVGCMFGRYSLDALGLILANQGETLADYLARIPEPRFMPDEDNVIPVLDADWFPDDIVARARDFIRITFGEAKFRENLAFVEAALGKDLRKYFTRDFYADHVQRYKKRPIYWMFSSPKGSFSALIYMHRYRPDTVSVVLNQYLRDYIGKLEVERATLDKRADDPTATPGQRTKAQKDVGAVIKQIEELTAWERDVVYPMAQAKIAIDLDDGVKRNYPLFTGALKPIKGLEAADD